LRAVAGGGTYLGPGIDPGVLTRLHRGPEDPYDRLTPREREVLALIAQGRTNPQIGEALGLSVRTVDVHRSHLMRKLNIHDLTTLVKFAWNRGLGLKA
ncbi:MAG: response regulator transcription factor, partial [Planctomycetota bacterium]|nr:response regulator transcription factor [Planctomycetota bacterium]